MQAWDSLQTITSSISMRRCTKFSSYGQVYSRGGSNWG